MIWDGNSNFQVGELGPQHRHLLEASLPSQSKGKAPKGSRLAAMAHRAEVVVSHCQNHCLDWRKGSDANVALYISVLGCFGEGSWAGSSGSNRTNFATLSCPSS